MRTTGEGLNILLATAANAIELRARARLRLAQVMTGERDRTAPSAGRHTRR